MDKVKYNTMSHSNTREKVFTIVMADDNLNDHDLTLRALKDSRLNCNLTSVYNGAQLMDYLLKRGIYTGEQAGLPDLILVDLNMRLQDGFETIRQIKSYNVLRDIPIYVLTSSNFQTDENKVKELGVNGFYTKPILFEQTQELIRKICKEALE